jgi:5'-methylthioadenosine phosphorylase
VAEIGRLAVVAGSTALGPEGGMVMEAAQSAGALTLQRHAPQEEPARYVPPHLIDHGANMRRLRDGGCDRVLAIASVGSLSPSLAVGSLLCPNDFIALNRAGSAFGDARGHGTRGFDPVWRAHVADSWEEGAGAEVPSLRDGGVYWEAAGPRFETPAEVRLIAEHADVVGMTVASECTAAGDLGLRYAAICVVDNLANGLGAQPLTLEEFEAGRAASAERLAAGLSELLPRLGGVAA